MKPDNLKFATYKFVEVFGEDDKTVRITLEIDYFNKLYNITEEVSKQTNYIIFTLEQFDTQRWEVTIKAKQAIIEFAKKELGL